MAAFRRAFDKAKHIVILTGAGVSAESGVPTFRGAGGFWRTYQAQQLASPYAFSENPSLVWEFYHYRREVMLTKNPNPEYLVISLQEPVIYDVDCSILQMTNNIVTDQRATMSPLVWVCTICKGQVYSSQAHLAIADCERRLKTQGRRVVVITQNIDELHKRAGSENIFELHGNLFTTRCTKCGDIAKNYDSPICEALGGKGSPDPEAHDARIKKEDLPRCKKSGCDGMTRPHVVWFGESLDPTVIQGAEDELEKCDLCLVVGTSSVVYPAAMFAPMVASRGVPVAEFNLEATDKTSEFGFHFQGPCGTTVPEGLAPTESETPSQA